MTPDFAPEQRAEDSPARAPEATLATVLFLARGKHWRLVAVIYCQALRFNCSLLGQSFDYSDSRYIRAFGVEISFDLLREKRLGQCGGWPTFTTPLN